MENDKNEKFNNFDSEFAFILDYKEQNLNNNIGYKNWETSMIKKFGNNARLFKCSKDNLLFYTSNQECKEFPFYVSTCPYCKREICYFCSRFSQDEAFSGNCCLKRGIYYAIFESGCNTYIKYGHIDPPPEKFIKISLMPYINMQFLISLCFKFFFLGLPKKNAEDIDDGNLITYEQDFYNKHHHKTLKTILFILKLFFVFLSLPYIIFSFFFMILLFLISLPFKGFPICFFWGVIFGSPKNLVIEDEFDKLYSFN